MIKIDSETKDIYLTRGDAPTKFNRIAVCLPVYNGDTRKIENYQFQLTDKISFVVFDKKGYTRREVFRIDYTLKDIGYSQPTESVEIPLTEELTKKFEKTNKSKTYWYDIALNDTTTILGFDENGAKKLIVYPEGGEANE